MRISRICESHEETAIYGIRDLPESVLEGKLEVIVTIGEKMYLCLFAVGKPLKDRDGGLF